MGWANTRCVSIGAILRPLSFGFGNQRQWSRELEKPRQKPLIQSNLSRSEQKAAEIDAWVKGHMAQCREAEKAKASRLKALREARKAEVSQPKPRPEHANVSPPRQARRVRRIWISGNDTLSDPKRRDR
jgi:hypothetical protein